MECVRSIVLRIFDGRDQDTLVNNTFGHLIMIMAGFVRSKHYIERTSMRFDVSRCDEICGDDGSPASQIYSSNGGRHVSPSIIFVYILFVIILTFLYKILKAHMRSFLIDFFNVM